MKIHKRIFGGLSKLFSRERPPVFYEENCTIVLCDTDAQAISYRRENPPQKPEPIPGVEHTIPEMIYYIVLEDYCAKTLPGRFFEKYSPFFERQDPPLRY